jgi:hypothetical protein
MTIESIMCMGIGFLFAALIGVAVMPLVHGRAVRLTTRRLEAALPQSMAEIQADKDLLRAEFAMSTCRLESLVEQTRNKTTSQLVELGNKENTINRLKIERDALSIEVIALKSRIEAAANSTKMAGHACLVPIVPTFTQSTQEDTWTRDDSTTDASLVPTIGHSDTWARNESSDQSMQEDTRVSDTSLVIRPSTDEQDTWARDESAGGGPADQLYAANRLAKALSQHTP